MGDPAHPIRLLPVHESTCRDLLCAYTSFTRVRSLVETAQEKNMQDFSQGKWAAVRANYEQFSIIEMELDMLNEMYEKVLTALGVLKVFSLDEEFVKELDEEGYRGPILKYKRPPQFKRRTCFLTPKMYSVLGGIGNELQKFCQSVEKQGASLDQLSIRKFRVFLSDFYWRFIDIRLPEDKEDADSLLPVRSSLFRPKENQCSIAKRGLINLCSCGVRNPQAWTEEEVNDMFYKAFRDKEFLAKQQLKRSKSMPQRAFHFKAWHTWQRELDQMIDEACPGQRRSIRKFGRTKSVMRHMDELQKDRLEGHEKGEMRVVKPDQPPVTFERVPKASVRDEGRIWGTPSEVRAAEEEKRREARTSFGHADRAPTLRGGHTMRSVSDWDRRSRRTMTVDMDRLVELDEEEKPLPLEVEGVFDDTQEAEQTDRLTERLQTRQRTRQNMSLEKATPPDPERIATVRRSMTINSRKSVGQFSLAAASMKSMKGMPTMSNRDRQGSITGLSDLSGVPPSQIKSAVKEALASLGGSSDIRPPPKVKTNTIAAKPKALIAAKIGGVSGDLKPAIKVPMVGTSVIPKEAVEVALDFVHPEVQAGPTDTKDMEAVLAKQSAMSKVAGMVQAHPKAHHPVAASSGASTPVTKRPANAPPAKAAGNQAGRTTSTAGGFNLFGW